jgi:hypothetical protein
MLFPAGLRKRKYAVEQRISENQALESGIKEKRERFLEKDSEVYSKA